MSLLGVKKLILCSRRKEELERVKQECKAQNSPAEIEVTTLDLSEPDACLKWASEIGETIDILVNNGGISQKEMFEDMSFQVGKRIIDVNALSPIAIIKGLLPQFLKNPKGA